MTSKDNRQIKLVRFNKRKRTPQFVLSATAFSKVVWSTRVLDQAATWRHTLAKGYLLLLSEKTNALLD